MIKISAKSIEEALLLASQELHCSCVDLEYEIVQYPSNGIFGVFKQEAQIVASIKSKQIREKPKNEQHKKCDINDVLNEIEEEINELFSLLPFKLNKIEVSKYNQNTILIHFKGEDSALLIGEKGYRYKAISYLLFNWINPKYGFNIRLEIEQFLVWQEEMIDNYLESIIHDINNSTQDFITKPLDGILVYIALKKLRAHFPNRRILVKTNEHNETYIVITQQNNA